MKCTLKIDTHFSLGVAESSWIRREDDEYASISPNNKKLKSFTKVDLDAGESKALSFLLTTNDFTFIDDSGNAILEKGNFTIEVLNQKLKIKIN